MFASGRARALIAFVRAVPKSAMAPRYIGCTLRGEHGLLARPPQRFLSHIKFLSSLLQDFRGTAAAATALHCTALRAPATAKFRAALRLAINASTAIARRLVQDAQRAHLSDHRQLSLESWRRCHSVSEDPTSSSPGIPPHVRLPNLDSSDT